jgi:D-alanine-D-alanine ligase-like ATP-grasp enzyme
MTTWMRTISILYGALIIRGLHIVCGGKTVTDTARVSTERARVLWEEAIRRGIQMEQLLLCGHAIDSYRAYIGGKWLYFESLPIPPLSEIHMYPWTDDKFLFKKLLQHHRIPVAEGRVSTRIDDAQRLYGELRTPVVVKPRIGSNSRHTTPYVQTMEQFTQAFALSQQLSRCVLFEEHIQGNLCRATVVGGVLVGFLESMQAQVMGDGVHTVRELVAEKNAHKRARVSDVVLNEENVAHIERQGYTLDAVLEHGVSIAVARLPGCSSGGGNREILESVHPHLRAYVEKVAEILHCSIVGFDLIIPDPLSDPDTQTWGILEANTLPFIEIHQDPLEGIPSNVAGAIWDLWK